MSKSKKNTKRKKLENLDRALSALREALDRIEGVYSNIPECCIEGFINGRTYLNVRNSLKEKDQKKLEKWHYVPCEDCFKKNNVNELQRNGMSDLGQIIFATTQIIADRIDNL